MRRRTPKGEAYDGQQECAVCGCVTPKNELVKQKGHLVCPDCVDVDDDAPMPRLQKRRR